MANILVVDDELGIRELLSDILNDEGHSVITAENAQQAREKRAESKPDLVLLDIWMPNTDGVTLLKEWSRDGLLTMPVIMMSGHATIDTALDAIRIGAINFLEKPITMAKLLGAVSQALTNPGEKPAIPAPAKPAAKPQPQKAPDTGPLATAPVSFSLPPSHVTISLDMPLREARDQFERMYFQYHLENEGGSMTRVSEKTGLERTHLYRKLKQLGVMPSKPSKKSGKE